MFPARPNAAVTALSLFNVTATPLTVVPMLQVVEPPSFVNDMSIPAIEAEPVVLSEPSWIVCEIATPDQVPETDTLPELSRPIVASPIGAARLTVTPVSVYSNSCPPVAVVSETSSCMSADTVTGPIVVAIVAAVVFGPVVPSTSIE